MGDSNDSGDENTTVNSNDGSTKERRKIEIKFIENKTRRHVTFSKRKHGIMKKAFELSVLTGTQVLLLVVSETGLVYTFSTPKFEPIVTQQEGRNLIQACLNAPDEEEEEEENDHQHINASNTNNNNSDNISTNNNENVNSNPNNAGSLIQQQGHLQSNQLIPNIKQDNDIDSRNIPNNGQYNHNQMVNPHMQPNLQSQQNGPNSGLIPTQGMQPQPQHGNTINVPPNVQASYNASPSYFNNEQNAVYQQYFQESHQGQY
ncbi:hypothetical protein Kpol_1073p26 [Vanderwaltozyma polyspora DSM 70294]|uniref:MADS-box domain-containing protein n=1 Tax=Vanderwaltozyma polyspora (strain ATCC 22028 / DSM 70294 / BCRC 21397 / CBS 2163 / NBRC 10782 / NRRL Y-8283 / UCD 57-17) TaxID=436907 RepID=A7TPT7_VANPO|nr:uncharacterized protein Kpol_1073p26 [Vanderwaltozyma polyspora DSM 70294]EDO15738.1 hypothetical protein Kpol_1073p26 [Vanderwaltozyma polyspora DSM 70294]